MRREQWTVILFLLLLVPGPVFAQEPAKQLTVIFKDVTQHDSVSLVTFTLKQTKRVNPFVMKKAQRGFIEYEGRYVGPEGELVEMLNIAIKDKLQMETKNLENGLEITLHSTQAP